MEYLYIKLKKLEDHNMFKIYIWSGGFQMFLLRYFHLAMLFDVDERGEYFQVTLGIWKPTITIQIGTINYDKKNSRRTNLKNT